MSLRNLSCFNYVCKTKHRILSESASPGLKLTTTTTTTITGYNQILPESASPGLPGEASRAQECHTAALSPLLSISPDPDYDDIMMR